MSDSDDLMRDFSVGAKTPTVVAPAVPSAEPSAATSAKIPVRGIDKSNYVRIKLNEDAANIPPTGLGVGVNGTAYLIKPGVEVDVPPSVVEVLDHAVATLPNVEPGSGRIIGWNQRLRFPYQRITRKAA